MTEDNATRGRDWPELTGEDARQLIRSLGWSVFITDGLTVAGRALSLPQGSLVGIRCATAVLKSRHEPVAGRDVRARLLVVAHGYATLRLAGGAPMLLSAGELVIVAADADLTLGVTEQVALLEYAVPLDRLDDRRRPELRLGHVHISDPPAVAEFATRVEGHLDQGQEVSPDGAEELQQMLDSASVTLLEKVLGPTDQELTAREAELIDAAGEAVAVHRADRSFTVNDLAAELGVSRVYLHRVFAKVGTTPSAFLRQARTR
ncbi:MAG: AraC family transcriptional regulator [Actinobacteria bacterium]|nr:AraC family transcriptional regulator [Actinomycetota bacterium]